MIKTIKVKSTKQLRVDELIKYIFDNKIKSKRFSDTRDINIVVSDSSGYINFINRVCSTDMIDRKKIFEIEEEKYITEDTVFRNIVIYAWDHTTQQHFYVTGVDDSVLGAKKHLANGQELVEVIVPIDNKSTTIWEREGE